MELNYNSYKEISPRFYGLFLEDINFSVDGGLNVNQLINPSFEAAVCKFKQNFHYWYFLIFHARRRFITRYEKSLPLLYWEHDGAVRAETDSPLNANNPHYLRLTVNGLLTLKNYGFTGGTRKNTHKRVKKDKNACAVGIKKGSSYDFSVYIRNEGFSGDLTLFTETVDGKKLTSVGTLPLSEKTGWKKYELSVFGEETGTGRFVARFSGNGSLSVDEWSFGESEFFGVNDPKWSGGRFRKDLVELIKQLKPAFLRFPGGCLVEGYSLKNGYNWKDTVGKTEERKHKINLWGEAQKDGCYMQSYAIGFYEYFLLCEELGAEPLPILQAGLACQGRTSQSVSEGDALFEEFKQNVFDLIEYANGDPKTDKWAALRAESGHPKPFNLKMLGVGNENWGEIYNKNFDVIYAAVKARYPDIEIVWSAGCDCYKENRYDEHRALFDGKHDDCISDDHFYRTPEWVISHVGLYDDYDRNRCRIFLGEYAANIPWNGDAKPNNWASALAEACFLTGLERNGDIVVMSSYAPLFSRVGGEQWDHNLINYNSLNVMKTTNYYVQELYANNFGTRYLGGDTGDPEVFCSVTTDGKKVYVKAVNISRTEKTFELSIKNAELGKNAELTTLACDDDYARNILPFIGEAEEKILPKKSVVSISDSIKLTLSARSVNVVTTDIYSSIS